jgi:sugar lactone lactonase YvrE
MSLLHPSRPTASEAVLPHLDTLTPRAAIPGGTFEVTGANLILTGNEPPRAPMVFFGEKAASLDMVRSTRALVRVPEGAISSDLTFRTSDEHHHALVSNSVYATIGVPMTEELHLVGNPCVDSEGNVYAMVSGPRGQSVPVSIYRVSRDLQIQPFVRDLLNVSALAIGADGYVYASSRSEGTVYRISPEGAITTFAEGMGLATGIAFDAAGNLFVGDRSGTIFKISPTKEIFVFATLEPSVAAYHLCFRGDGTLLVAAPNTGSSQSLYAIDPDGNTTVFFHGLGRPQGMALDEHENLYIAATYRGKRGIIRITPEKHAELYLSGNDLVGLCFLEDGCAAIGSNDSLFHVDLGINGRPLV